MELIEAIKNAVAARRAAQDTVDILVLEARSDGATWDEIASALGVSRQAAHQNYRYRETK